MAQSKAKRQAPLQRSTGLARAAVRSLSPGGESLVGTRLSQKVLSGIPLEIRPILTTSYGAFKANLKRRFVVYFEPNRAPTIRSIEDDEPDEALKNESDLNAELAEARSRGQGLIAKILDRDDMLNDEDFGKLIGVSRTTVHSKHRKHEVLGVEGAKRGTRFPAWQIGKDGKPFLVLPELFAQLGDNPWTIYRFLVQHHPELDGLTACEALQRGQSETVIGVAESVARGVFS